MSSSPSSLSKPFCTTVRLHRFTTWLCHLLSFTFNTCSFTNVHLIDTHLRCTSLGGLICLLLHSVLFIYSCLQHLADMSVHLGWNHCYSPPSLPTPLCAPHRTWTSSPFDSFTVITPPLLRNFHLM